MSNNTNQVINGEHNHEEEKIKLSMCEIDDIKNQSDFVD